MPLRTPELLCRALPRLVPSQLVCRQCLLRQQPRVAPSRVLRPLRPGRLPPHVRYASSESASSAVSSQARFSRFFTSSAVPTPAAAGVAAQAAARAFPETSSRSVAYWLIGSAASVFGIVVFGGLTRLTESGLSITEWRPVTGSLPPVTEADWESEFEKYRASPEFRMLNSHMDLDEFKKIYYMEWTHRLWGRFVGLSFVLPAVYFVARRRVSPRTAAHLFGISALIGFQGFIGWWMVKSGLRDDLFAPGSHPRVSQYRLATHLAAAFVCYSWMLLAGLRILRTHRLLADPAVASKAIEALKNPVIAPFRRSVAALTVLVFVTVLSGALVAGLDAGLIYNEFPMMGVGLTPPRSELWDKFYSRREDGSDLWWRNLLENPSLVQLDHRILATTTFCAVLALFAYSRTGRIAAVLPRNAKKGTTGIVHLVCLQVALGITTLIYMVPISLAAAHQAGSLALLTGVLVLGHRLRVPKSTLAIVQKRLASTAKLR
ncbi:COX15-CtaA-domain-containing protein [Durotheca rogersii]|uniref:COX15-CtaA-domain-containing protein n=1 Tax=Durotheca rogersii TaxID=419775 RepID=UPI0022208690|nr:COX15-CtaA-domain-containing protein [Durotheca rogersii]KAI5866108.1 COX15-CtaA-domain-containing protein [Durotheca rogersii]